MKRFVRIAIFIAPMIVVTLGLHSQGTHNITLKWTPGTGGITAASFNVKRSVSTGTEVQLANVPVGTTTYVDTMGVGGVTYFYVVTAVGANGAESAPSNEVSATFLPLPAPAVPAQLGATSN